MRTNLRHKLPFPLAELARRLGLSRQAYANLHRQLSGKAGISPNRAMQIEKETSGAIRWTEFFDAA